MKKSLCYTLGKRAFHVPAFGILTGAAGECFDLFDTRLPAEVTRRAAACLAGEIGADRLVRSSSDEYMRFRPDQMTDRPVYLFCSIRAAAHTRVMLREHVTGPSCKLWINARFVTAHGVSLDQRQFLELEKGHNQLVIGLPSASADVFVALRVSRCDAETAAGPGSLCHENLLLGEHSAHVVWRGDPMPEDRQFPFLLIPNDDRLVDRSKPVQCSVIRPYAEREEDRCATVVEECVFYQPYTIDLSAWDYDHVEEANNIGIRFDYTLRTGEAAVMWVDLFLHDPAPALQAYTELAREALASDWPSDYDRLALTFHLRQPDYPDPQVTLNTFYMARNIKWCLQAAETDTHNDWMQVTPGNHWHYFRSALDQQVEQCMITLPEGYDPARRYPLLLVLATGRYSSDGWPLYRYTDKPLIIADVSGRGVTMGAYIGEAALWETVDWICAEYPIDRDRVYAMGYSNGATAAWEQAKNYPDRFAAIFTVAGRVNEHGCGNVGNLRVLNLMSAYDRACVPFRPMDKRLRRFPGYTGIWTQSMDHNDLSWMRGKTWYLDQMCKETRNPYPDRVAYATTRHRHRQAYWLTIHAIAFGKREAAVTAAIADGVIRVDTRNVTGFTITLPPQVPRGRFSVVVNRARAWTFAAFTADALHFARRGHRFVPVAEPPAGPVSRKGTGLLDVYLGPMRIAVADPGNPALTRAAQAFAVPVTNGFYREIYVQYPIRPAGELSAADKACHLIVLDDLSGEDAWLQELRARCPIQLDKDGFTYRGRRREGDYCVMQVFANPAAPERSVLHIGVNNPALLRKNLFTRKVVLPSYLNGFHPYWNQEGLVYMDNTYSGVYEWGMDMAVIEAAR